jgi:hypothetical protein|tara:strand:+ start:1086 stop:1535 length:450 start_codon:yes stop_codon:yes gene_type:complete
MIADEMPFLRCLLDALADSIACEDSWLPRTVPTWVKEAAFPNGALDDLGFDLPVPDPMCPNLNVFKPPERISGIYLLYAESCEDILYVGESRDVYARVIQHQRLGEIPFDYAAFLEIKKDTDRYHGAIRRRVEHELIKRLQPEYNRRGK